MNLPARTSRELYPPQESPEQRALLHSLVSFTYTNGDVGLRRKISEGEKRQLLERMTSLRSWIDTGKSRDLARAFSNMMLGFGGKDIPKDEAEMIITQYVNAARAAHLPLWAVERACLRFASGNVSAEELGQNYINRSYRPSSAHVCIIAKAIVDPVRSELHGISAVLRGRVDEPVVDDGKTPEERAEFASAWAERTKAEMKKVITKEREEMRARVNANAAKTIAYENKQRRLEYVNAGLAPPEGPSIVSLSLMLQMGYRIEEINGEKVLTR